MSAFDDFLSKYGPAFAVGGTQANIDPSFIAAQGGLESNWGQSALATQANNLFGIKGRGDAGSISMMTTEFIGGRAVRVPQNFAAYSSPEASVSAYTQLLSGSKRYAGIVGATGAQAANIIGKSGYATDPNYGGKIAGLVSKIDKSGILAGATKGLLSKASSLLGTAGLDAIVPGAGEVAGLIPGLGGIFGGGPLEWIKSLINWLFHKFFIDNKFIERIGLFIVGGILLLMAFYLLGRNTPEFKAVATAAAL